MSSQTAKPSSGKPHRSSATQFFLRGLAIVLPAILTVAILIWIGGIINSYIVRPISYGVRYSLAQAIERSRPRDELVRWDRLPPLEYWEGNYRITQALRDDLQEEFANRPGPVPVERIERVIRQTGKARLLADSGAPPQVYVPLGNSAVPYVDYSEVARNMAHADVPKTATGVYMEYVTLLYFGSHFLLSAVAVSVAIVALYFLGRLVTVRVGGWAVHRVETLLVGRLPIISNVYSSVKQVTDFLFSERHIEYNRVVAIEYPRRGIWSLGFVTGDSMLEITSAAGEPMVSVLVATSPMPMTGFTVSVPRSEVLDLNLSIDQAFQFCLSCGVLVPPHQKVTPELLQQELAEQLTPNTKYRLSSESRPQPSPAAQHAEDAS